MRFGRYRSGARFGKSCKGQQARRDEQHDAHQHQIGGEESLDGVLEEEADDGNGYHGDEQVDDISGLFVHPESEQPFEQLHYLTEKTVMVLSTVAACTAMVNCRLLSASMPNR